MSKVKSQPVTTPTEAEQVKHIRERQNINEPLSGSKKTKNRNHSRQNHGEGH